MLSILHRQKSVNEILSAQLFDETGFYKAFINDLLECKSEMITFLVNCDKRAFASRTSLLQKIRSVECFADRFLDMRFLWDFFIT